MGDFRNYDDWKQTLPPEEIPVMKCDSCGCDLYVGDHYFEISANEKICACCLVDSYRKEVKEDE